MTLNMTMTSSPYIFIRVVVQSPPLYLFYFNSKAFKFFFFFVRMMQLFDSEMFINKKVVI